MELLLDSASIECVAASTARLQMGNIRLLLVSALKSCILYVQSSQLLDEAAQNLANTKILNGTQ